MIVFGSSAGGTGVSGPASPVSTSDAGEDKYFSGL